LYFLTPCKEKDQCLHLIVYLKRLIVPAGQSLSDHLINTHLVNFSFRTNQQRLHLPCCAQSELIPFFTSFHSLYYILVEVSLLYVTYDTLRDSNKCYSLSEADS